MVSMMSEQRQYYFYVVFNDDSEKTWNCRSKKEAIELYKNFDTTPYKDFEWEEQPREWSYHYNVA